jgi:hypothetical protein
MSPPNDHIRFNLLAGRMDYRMTKELASCRCIVNQAKFIETRFLNSLLAAVKVREADRQYPTAFVVIFRLFVSGWLRHRRAKAPWCRSTDSSWEKNGPNAAADTVPKMKKSYHSSKAPMRLAVATLFISSDHRLAFILIHGFLQNSNFLLSQSIVISTLTLSGSIASS